MDKLIVYIVIFILFFGAIFGFGFIKSTVKSEVIDTVVKSERIVYSKDSKYLIYGENEVYENTDTLWYGKWNSSDFYRDIKPNHKYKFTVVGWRVPSLSWYRNIIKYEEVR